MIGITCNLCGSTNKIRLHEDHNKELCKECHNKIHRDRNKSKGARKDGYTEYINSDDWKAKREEAFKHYGRKCTKCGSVNLLHVHHNTYVNFRHEEIKDLNVLCEVCHMALHDRINKRTILRVSKNVVKKTKQHKTKNNKKKNTQKRVQQKPVKTMLEVIESIKQTQANTVIKRALKEAKNIKEIKKHKEPMVYKENNVHIGIGTPSQRGYNKNNPLPVELPKKEKAHKPKPKKSNIIEPVKVKSWLDEIQEDYDKKRKTVGNARKERLY